MKAIDLHIHTIKTILDADFTFEIKKLEEYVDSESITLNKNVKNYYETTVDVIFKWLEFQNSFGRIPNISWFTFSPQLHEIKQETYDVLINFGIKNGDLIPGEINMIAEHFIPDNLGELTEGITYYPYGLGVDVKGFFSDYLGYELNPEMNIKKI